MEIVVFGGGDAHFSLCIQAQGPRDPTYMHPRVGIPHYLSHEYCVDAVCTSSRAHRVVSPRTT